MLAVFVGVVGRRPARIVDPDLVVPAVVFVACDTPQRIGHAGHAIALIMGIAGDIAGPGHGQLAAEDIVGVVDPVAFAVDFGGDPTEIIIFLARGVAEAIGHGHLKAADVVIPGGGGTAGIGHAGLLTQRVIGGRGGVAAGIGLADHIIQVIIGETGYRMLGGTAAFGHEGAIELGNLPIAGIVGGIAYQGIGITLFAIVVGDHFVAIGIDAIFFIQTVIADLGNDLIQGVVGDLGKVTGALAIGIAAAARLTGSGDRERQFRGQAGAVQIADVQAGIDAEGAVGIEGDTAVTLFGAEQGLRGVGDRIEGDRRIGPVPVHDDVIAVYIGIGNLDVILTGSDIFDEPTEGVGGPIQAQDLAVGEVQTAGIDIGGVAPVQGHIPADVGHFRGTQGVADIEVVTGHIGRTV